MDRWSEEFGNLKETDSITEKGKVMSSSFEYIRSLNAGNGQQIPTLDEVVKLVDGRCGINVELKGPDTALPVSEYLAKLCSASSSSWHTEQFMLSSFYHKELALADPTFRRGALFHKPVADYFQRTSDLGAYSINLSLKIVNQQSVLEAHEKGLKVFVYTVNDEDDIARMAEIGVDGVFCDFPDRVINFLKS